jgi:hypothetical protein
MQVRCRHHRLEQWAIATLRLHRLQREEGGRLPGDEIDEIEAQIKELGIEQTKVVGVGALRELEILLELKNQYAEYTRNEIEQGQEKYWDLRLNQQTIDPNQQAINQTKSRLRQIK